MYRFARWRIGAFPTLALVVVALTAAGAVEAAGDSACTKVSNSCTEWIALGHGSARAMIYTTFPLDVPNTHVRRALIMVHEPSDQGPTRRARGEAFMKYLRGHLGVSGRMAA